MDGPAKPQSLAQRLVDAEELERHRIAGELHDRVGQNLSALNINLDIALGLLPRESLEARMRLVDSLALLEDTLHAIEGLMAELRPPLLDEYGLGAALDHYVRGFSQRTGVRVEVEDPEELGGGLRREAAIALFRIAQEALANVARHAGAARAVVRLSREPGGTVLAVEDDGRGFDPGERLAQSRRWGMARMRERAAAIGGALELEARPGAGTRVRVVVPAPTEAAP